jgi:DNA-binding winged helix-turn-helix (wHTH) protein
MRGRFYVGEWLVEPEQSRVVRGNETAKLDPKAILVLSFLADHPNEVLTKEQIISGTWRVERRECWVRFPERARIMQAPSIRSRS